MSNTTTAIETTGGNQLAVLQKKFADLDKFAADNSISTILEGNGAFDATFKMSLAHQQLREMITSDMMKPIMALQGSALGFRTDQDKAGGYKEEVVKEVLIEATIKGFRMVNNETNIIGGRFYAARDGFERIFRDLSKSGKLTDLRLLPQPPKTTADGALVDYAASWTFKGIKDELKLSIPIRVNAGQGPDAVLGKAKRKMLAAIYSRITGTEITDGDVDDPKTIDVTAKPVAEQKSAAGLDAATIAELEAILVPHEEAANKYLVDSGTIQPGMTFREIPEVMARRIIKNRDSFFKAIGAK
jgi:hypothetical protein